MAVQENQNLEMVPVFADDEQEPLMSIDTKQVLSASFLKQIHQEYIPLHRFVQQPTMALTSSETMDDDATTKMLIPISDTLTDSVKQDQQDGKEGTALMAIPISYCPPEQSQPYPWMNNEIVLWQGGAESEMATPRRTTELSYIERKENWIVRRLPRSKPNRWDTYYVHLKTDVQFRSLIDVHTFIMHGILPERRKANKGDDAHNNTRINNPQSRKIRGDKLLNRVPVGYYNLTRQEILRNELSPVRDDSSSTVVGNGTKRKREDEAPTQGNNGELIFTLYDFEPIC